jgi:pilus assembly protein CpaB
MDSAKLKKVLILGGMGLAVFFLMRIFLTPQPVQAPEFAAPVVEQTEIVRVLVASEDIPLGTRLTSDYLSWTDWPKDSLRASLITDQNADIDPITDLEGSIVKAEIFEGEPINAAKIVRAGDSGVLAAMLKPGMRAVTTRISVETAAGGFIQPGDRVDILLTEQFDIRTNNGPADRNSGIVRDEVHIANIIFENVQVLAIDQTYATDPEGEAYVIGSTATFELSPDDAVMLQEAQSAGEISLILRGLNSSRTKARSAAQTTIYEQEAPPSDLVVYRSGEPQRVAIRGK